MCVKGCDEGYGVVRTRYVRYVGIFALLASMLVAASPAAAVPIGDQWFQRTWEREDRPIIENLVTRSWLWGPEAYSDVLWEDFADSPGGKRKVQYFDKSRMEITDPLNGEPNWSWPDPRWYVTNGLLPLEMISGMVQVGLNEFESKSPAQVPVAGDPNDADGPYYSTFTNLRGAAPLAVGSTVTQRITRAGAVSNDPSTQGYGVTIARVENATNHSVASVFETFIQTQGLVYNWVDRQLATETVSGVYAVGYPITEPYWARVQVGGTVKDVLVQCFERRCLTYTPDNSPEWRVEMGNVGQHYYRWRYDTTSNPPVEGHVFYSSSMSDWSTWNTGDETAYWTGSAWQVTLAPDRLLFAPPPFYIPAGPGISAAADVRIVPPAPQTRAIIACVAVRHYPGAQASSLGVLYELCLDSNGYFSAWEEDFRGTGNRYRLLMEHTRLENRNASADWHRLKIIAKGDTLWFVVNDQLLGTATHNGLTPDEGDVIIANEGTTAGTVQYRNFEMRVVT
jgi:hypothetical protein